MEASTNQQGVEQTKLDKIFKILNNVYTASSHNTLMYKISCSATTETILYLAFVEPSAVGEIADYIKDLAAKQPIPLTLDNIGYGREDIRPISFEVGRLVLQRLTSNDKKRKR